MRLVADANILFAALVRDGLTRRVWFRADVQVFCPHFITSEFLEHKAELLRKTGGSPDVFEDVLARLLRQCTVLSDDAIEPLLPHVAALCNDEDDWPYLACALAVNADVWSNDHDFDGQTRVKIWKTAELARELGLLK